MVVPIRRKSEPAVLKLPSLMNTALAVTPQPSEPPLTSMSGEVLVLESVPKTLRMFPPLVMVLRLRVASGEARRAFAPDATSTRSSVPS